MAAAPPDRVRRLNRKAENPDGDYVLYWMIANRRLRSNFALDHALAHARRLDRPLLVFEPLRAGYEHAGDRFHVFAIQGMADHAAEAEAAGLAGGFCGLVLLIGQPAAVPGLLAAPLVLVALGVLVWSVLRG